MAEVVTEGLEEGLEARGVEMPVGRQLELDGPQAVPEQRDAIQEGGEAIPGILEFLHVGDVTTGLGGEDEAVGHRLPPFLEGIHRRQMVEGIIDLDTREAGGVI